MHFVEPEKMEVGGGWKASLQRAQTNFFSNDMLSGQVALTNKKQNNNSTVI